MDILEKIRNKEEIVWINPNHKANEIMSEIGGQKYIKIKAAQNRLLRFMPFIESHFPETSDKKGLIESALINMPGIESFLREEGINVASGSVYLKDDAHLPIAGSVKARGGIHEVLKHAEELAIKAHMIKPDENYIKFDSDEFREFFGQYTIQVGSTGNLGISVGTIAAGLGFNAVVHMSEDAKEWKKQLLRDNGVNVIEHEGNYGLAVENGRKLSDNDPMSFFVDDENSEDLFMGYATAALRLKVQLYKNNIAVDKEHPLFVYIPCGVGGAPGGVTFGLKQLFGENVHCFFAEPTGAPCLTLGMACGKKSSISIYDIGLDGKTIADGLAVGRPSGFVCDMMDTLLSGTCTVSDEKLIDYMKIIYNRDSIFLEPSACAGLHGLVNVYSTPEIKEYLEKNNILQYMGQATHIIWATGGGLVPEDTKKQLLEA